MIERADSNVITVISLIRSKVSSLCLHEIRGSPARSTPCALEKLNFRLCGSNMLFGALTDLTLASDFDDDLGKVYGYISGIASLATRLETLRLYCPLGFYHDQLNKDKASFPGVRRLIIEMRESGRQTVDIVKLFPHLERFDLSEGTSVRPSVEVAQAFFKVLGGLKRLDSLAWAYNSIPSFREYTEGSSSNALRSLKCVSDLQDEAVRLEVRDLSVSRCES